MMFDTVGYIFHYASRASLLFSTFLKLLVFIAIAIAIAIAIVHCPLSIVMACSSSLFNVVSFFLLPTQKNPSQIISTSSSSSYCDPLPSLSSSSSSSSVWFENGRNRYGGITLRYSSNFYCSPYEMFVDEDEPVESRITHFRRSVLRAGIIQEAKRRRFHENPREKKKRKSRDAARRNRRRRTPWRDEAALNEEDEEKKDDDDDNQDNWEYSEGGIPYY